MIALFIGRFQPFHNGHLHLIIHLSQNYKHIIIGIGSSQYSHTSENPFTFEERTHMITTTLINQKISNFTIVAIPDLHDPPNWVKHVTSLIQPFDIVITNNDFTTQLFKEKGYTVKHTPIFNRKEYSGHTIRQRIQEHLPWNHLVPKEVYTYIQQIHSKKRLNQ